MSKRKKSKTEYWENPEELNDLTDEEIRDKMVEHYQDKQLDLVEVYDPFYKGKNIDKLTEREKHYIDQEIAEDICTDKGRRVIYRNNDGPEDWNSFNNKKYHKHGGGWSGKTSYDNYKYAQYQSDVEKANYDEVEEEYSVYFRDTCDSLDKPKGNFDFNKNIILTKKCYLKILAHVRLLGSDSFEIGGLLKIRQEKKNFIIHDIVLLPQVASSSDFVFDDKPLHEYFLKNMNTKDIKDVWGWWHSHHNMGRFWSSTDDSAFEKLSSRIGIVPVQCLGLVFTNDGKFLARYDVNTPIGRVQLDGLKVKIGIDSEKKTGKKVWQKSYETMFKNTKKEVKKMVDKEVWVPKGAKVKYYIPKKKDKKLSSIEKERLEEVTEEEEGDF